MQVKEKDALKLSVATRLVHGTAVGVLAVLAIGCSEPEVGKVEPSDRDHGGAEANRVSKEGTQPRQLKILYPLDGALFPPEIAAPTFRWEDDHPDCDAWQIAVRFQEGPAMASRSHTPEWTPSDEQWETIKHRSLETAVTVTVLGVDSAVQDKVLSKARVSIRTSKDEVGAPLFYREVNLPFREAVKDPSHIRWRFGDVSSKQQPPVVLEKLPVCGNCHSFSADGTVLGMDVDYANDKGSYAISPVAEEMILDRAKIISWGDYRRKDGELTFGLLSQVSPDGRYVVSTVKDRSVFVARDELAFSQLFFPIQGILVYYDRESKDFHALSGADDPRLVQSNPTWSPDGKHIVFARSKVHRLKNVGKETGVLLPQEDCREFLEGEKTFLFDLYRIPFNDGKGGTPEPLEGASNNGMSNYFPKFSPDGKWIVFCKAESFMLLQPDSELYIIPAQGGTARRLQCNTSRMNSWHSWSPNGEWLVFSSKAYSDYTQLFLTHIDEQGRSSIPVVLSRLTVSDRAANIPEFVNVEPRAIQRIAEAFLDDHNYYRAAHAFIKEGDTAGAIRQFYKSLEINPKNEESRFELATVLADAGKIEEAKTHIMKVLELQPDDAEALHHLAVVLWKARRPQEAVDYFRRALDADPNLYEVHLNLGRVLLESGKLDESAQHLAEAVRLEPTNPFTNYYWGNVLHRQGKPEEALPHYRHALELHPEFIPALLALASIHIIDDRPGLYDVDNAFTCAKKACELTRHEDPDALRILSVVHGAAGRFDDAVTTARQAQRIAQANGDIESALRIHEMLKLYESLRAPKSK